MKRKDPSSRACRPQLELPKPSQEKFLDGVAKENLHLQPAVKEQSSTRGDFAQATTTLRTKKQRQSEVSPMVHEIDAAKGLLASRRITRSRRTGTTKPEVKQKEVPEPVKTGHQGSPPKRPRTLTCEPKVDIPVQVSPAKRLRKRKIGGDVDSNGNEHQLKPAPLTRRNLARFNKMVKMRSNAPPSASPESKAESTTKMTSTTTSGFAIKAYRNGILGPLDSKPPTNLADIRERLLRPRQTPSPSGSDFEAYQRMVEKAPNESTMVYQVGTTMIKNYEHEERGYSKVLNEAFTGFPKNVGFNNGLAAPQPDFVQGLDMKEYEPFSVGEHINGAVLYKDNPFSVTLPHLAGEWKGPGKDMLEARLQTSYDGAALVYARNQALNSMGQTCPTDDSKVTTFTTDGTTLNFFAHHAAPSEDGKLKYHQYLITTANLMSSFEEFKKGRRQLRNVQDDAREESHHLKDQLKDHWRQLQPDPDPSIEDEDEDEDGYEMIE